MKTVKLDINYTEYSSIDEMEPQDIELVKAAIEAQKGSYAPYSTFNVGAALRLEDGTIVKGANQENAAYPSGLCAERTAMFAASANNPGKAMLSLAIVGGFNGTLSDTPCSPCGACRQVMREFAQLDMPVILGDDKGEIHFESTMDGILPRSFGPEDLVI